MSKVRSDNISNRADDGAPALVYGAEVPVGYGITGAGGIDITGIATATSFSGPLTGNVTGNVSGNAATATNATTAAEATEASAAKSGSALETSLNGKTSPGKAIALSMVFG